MTRVENPGTVPEVDTSTTGKRIGLTTAALAAVGALVFYSDDLGLDLVPNLRAKTQLKLSSEQVLSKEAHSQGIVRYQTFEDRHFFTFNEAQQEDARNFLTAAGFEIETYLPQDTFHIGPFVGDLVSPLPSGDESVGMFVTTLKSD